VKAIGRRLKAEGRARALRCVVSSFLFLATAYSLQPTA
jgi:hypothetical protein